MERVDDHGGRHAPRASGMRVLFLTSGLGNGHTRAAQAVGLALAGDDSSVRVHVLDLWELMDAKVADALKTGYIDLVTGEPALYESLYHRDWDDWREMLEEGSIPTAVRDVLRRFQKTHFPDNRGWFSPKSESLDEALFVTLLSTLTTRSPRSEKLIRQGLLAWIRKLLVRRLKSELAAFEPQVVVATQVNLAALLTFLKRLNGYRSIPAVAVTTDFGAHGFWVQPSIDHYCVGTEEVARELAERGAPAASVHVTGIPLMPEFAAPPPPRDGRRALGLDPERPTVLVTGGGYGIGVVRALRELAADELGYQVVVLAGHAPEAVRRSLDSIVERRPERLKVLAWTTEMPSLLRAADVVVGKPGGLSVAEALACGRPFLACCSLGGQEGFNVRYLESRGLGGLVRPEALRERLAELFGSRPRLEEAQQRAWDHGCRDAAARVAGLVRGLAPGPATERAPELAAR